MTEEQIPEEEAITTEAQEQADIPAVPVEGAEGLPDDVADGEVNDDEEPAP